MRFHFLQHVHFETPANIYKWAIEKGFSINGTRLFLGEKFPDIESFDALIIMGGPMGVYDEKEYSWLKQEKIFIERCLISDKKILGVCLGAQLIADVMGAKVYRNKEKEIGWFPVLLTEDTKKSVIFSSFPESFVPLHWHGDTFEIPKGAIHTVKSEGCENQAFEYRNGKVIGLQFHLEMSKEDARQIIENSVNELEERGRFIQSSKEILKNDENFKNSKYLLNKLLDKWVEA